MTTMKELEERIENLEQLVGELVERLSYATSKIGVKKEECFEKKYGFDSIINCPNKYKKHLWSEATFNGGFYFVRVK